MNEKDFDASTWEPEDEKNRLHNQSVTVELENGSKLQFVATWNYGLGQFVGDYEWFLRGKEQPKQRYPIRTADRKTNNNIIVDFKKITSIHLNVNVG